MFPSFIVNLLKEVGVEINGANEWDPKITDDRFYDRVMREKNLGLGEAYMDGWCS